MMDLDLKIIGTKTSDFATVFRLRFLKKAKATILTRFDISSILVKSYN